MPNEEQKSFVKTFIITLKKQLQLNAMSADALESCAVAVQCLQTAFEVDAASASDGAADSAGGAAVAFDTKAIDLFEIFQSQYIEMVPKPLELAESIKNRGNRLMKDGKYNEALEQYNRAIQIDPKNAKLYCNRAAAHIR